MLCCVCSSLNEQNLSKELVDMNKKINKLKKDNQKLEAAKGKLETEVCTCNISHIPVYS